MYVEYLTSEFLFYITFAAFVIAIVIYLYYKPISKSFINKEFNDTIQLVFIQLNKQVRKLSEDFGYIKAQTERAINEFNKINYNEGQQSQIKILIDSAKDTLNAQTNIARAVFALNSKFKDLLNWKDEVNKRISRLETRSPIPISITEKSIQIPSGPSIAIARLTPTEMKVLSVLASSGSKTASEIREITGRTREHSARLMKKLYLEGYVERDTVNMPYNYKLSEKIRQSYEFSTNKDLK